jgi:ribose 5-phosphate isomerase A
VDPIESGRDPAIRPWSLTQARRSAVVSNTGSAKDRAAFAGAGLVESGMVVGLGSGSTAALMVRHLAARVQQEGLKVVGVPTSAATAELARSLKIPVRALDEVALLDLNLDGADEIDPQFRMIKGRGGALLREKIVACASARRVTMVTPEKLVERLGASAPIPVEVSTFGVKHTERLIQRLGAVTSIRCHADGSLIRTDGGNAILDCHFRDEIDPDERDRQLQALAGVLETGLFIGLCDTLIVGRDPDVDLITTGVERRP